MTFVKMTCQQKNRFDSNNLDNNSVAGVVQDQIGSRRAPSAHSKFISAFPVCKVTHICVYVYEHVFVLLIYIMLYLIVSKHVSTPRATFPNKTNGSR